MLPFLCLLILLFTSCSQDQGIRLEGLKKPVEVLRDRWGVPHIYAESAEDLFFAQGYMTARDRLFQIDLWRRENTGKLAEVMGPSAIPRDRIARLVRYRGDWDKEWASYDSEGRQIVTSFVSGINAYIKSLNGKYPLEFQLAGYAPGLWLPEDCAGRVAGLLMTRNLPREIERAIDIRQFGADMVSKVRPPDPLIPLQAPSGLDLNLIQPSIIRDFNQAIASARVEPEQQGSNNWVIDGAISATGKPLLANDPHRPIKIPSLRKTWHLVAPGWNVFGAGEPALPGIALGHNEEIAFGFTIVGIDQVDLYVEKLNPDNHNQYWYKGAWRDMEVLTDRLAVKGMPEQTVDLEYTLHGPVIYEDPGAHRAYALKWVGAEPGGAGYLAALRLSRAKNWEQFVKAVDLYKVPSENLVYADRAGNIGWIASGYAPIRRNWSGLLPVPGDSGAYEWEGYLPTADHPSEYNPPRHWIGTANHNILPEGYKHQLSYEWALPYRARRVKQMLAEKPKFTIEDFVRMQQDVTNLLARDFQKQLGGRTPPGGVAGELWMAVQNWDARMTPDSMAAAVFAVWSARLPEFLLASPLAARMDAAAMMRFLEKEKSDAPLHKALEAAARELTATLGPDRGQWNWGRLHTVRFEHPLRAGEKNQGLLDRGPLPRPGDGNTVNAASGGNFRQTAGASYRQIFDLADWDRSLMTNVPGESGDPHSRHYSDLLDDWAAGRYHPMPYSRKAVEAETVEKIKLVPLS